jgi:hypothetical protein
MKPSAHTPLICKQYYQYQVAKHDEEAEKLQN